MEEPSFNGTGFLKYQLPVFESLETSFRISFEFQTRAKAGVILWIGEVRSGCVAMEWSLFMIHNIRGSRTRITLAWVSEAAVSTWFGTWDGSPRPSWPFQLRSTMDLGIRLSCAVKLKWWTSSWMPNPSPVESWAITFNSTPNQVSYSVRSSTQSERNEDISCMIAFQVALITPSWAFETWPGVIFSLDTLDVSATFPYSRSWMWWMRGKLPHWVEWMSTTASGETAADRNLRSHFHHGSKELIRTQDHFSLMNRQSKVGVKYKNTHALHSNLSWPLLKYWSFLYSPSSL